MLRAGFGTRQRTLCCPAVHGWKQTKTQALAASGRFIACPKQSVQHAQFPAQLVGDMPALGSITKLVITCIIGASSEGMSGQPNCGHGCRWPGRRNMPRSRITEW